MNDIPRAVEALRLQAATTFLGSENGVGINMTTGEETASQQNWDTVPVAGNR